MKTPYDAALRIRQRELDELRVSISTQISLTVEIQASCEGVGGQLIQEGNLAAVNWGLSSSAYMARIRARRDVLHQQQTAAEARLMELRHHARDVYAALQAIEDAAAAHRESKARIVNAAEQAQADDSSAGRWAKSEQDRRTCRSQKERWA